MSATGFRIIQLCPLASPGCAPGNRLTESLLWRHPGVELTIDEYLRKRLMPVEGVIPQLVGIDMYGNSIPAGPVGGDLFEYINFQQRYNIDARIAGALKLSKEYLDPLPKGQTPRNSVDEHVEWLKSKTGYSDLPQLNTKGQKF